MGHDARDKAIIESVSRLAGLFEVDLIAVSRTIRAGLVARVVAGRM